MHFHFSAVDLLLRHLAYIASALGQLNAAEQGLPAVDDAGSSLQHTTQQQVLPPQLQQQQQAAAEASRVLLQELCAAVQMWGAMMDATSLANFVAAMGRLEHHDWPAMRHLAALAMRQAQVRGAPDNQPSWASQGVMCEEAGCIAQKPRCGLYWWMVFGQQRDAFMGLAL